MPEACLATLSSRKQNITVQESSISVEHAGARPVRKRWGNIDLRSWSAPGPGGTAVGEFRFERTDATAPNPAVLHRLLSANTPPSIQAHPDDASARSIGLPHGKTRAWIVVSATPDAKVAVGLKQPASSQKLRASIKDGSVAELILWPHVKSGDVLFVPADTVHAIGECS